MPSQPSLGAVLRRRRVEAGVTQEELAERCGLSVRAISDIERGVTGRPRRASVELIADALGLSQAELDELGNAAGEAHVLSNLGDVDRLEGRYLEATGHLRQALVLFRTIADRAGQAEALNGLGEVALATGRFARARAQHSAALDLYAGLGVPEADQVRELSELGASSAPSRL